jgi:hypothetical protein
MGVRDSLTFVKWEFRRLGIKNGANKNGANKNWREIVKHDDDDDDYYH